MRPVYAVRPQDEVNVAHSEALLTVKALDIAQAIEKCKCGKRADYGIQFNLTKPAPGVFDFLYFGAKKPFRLAMRFLMWNVLEKDSEKEWRIVRLESETAVVFSTEGYKNLYGDELPIPFLDDVFAGSISVCRKGEFSNYEVYAKANGCRSGAKSDTKVVGKPRLFSDVDQYVKAWIMAGAYIGVLRAQDYMRKVERTPAHLVNCHTVGVPDTCIMTVLNDAGLG